MKESKLARRFCVLGVAGGVVVDCAVTGFVTGWTGAGSLFCRTKAGASETGMAEGVGTTVVGVGIVATTGKVEISDDEMTGPAPPPLPLPLPLPPIIGGPFCSITCCSTTW